MEFLILKQKESWIIVYKYEFKINFGKQCYELLNNSKTLKITNLLNY
jgi:hypothetical protein